MKLIYSLPFCTLLFGQAFSQLVVTVPQYATENDSIVVRFDATQAGASELLNHGGTVYTHTGVTTNKGVWRYVRGTWGDNPSQPSLTRLGTNLYQLTIGRPRQFYAITDPTEHVQALDFVFRSADATRQTRPDIFVALFTSGLSVVVDSPSVSVAFGDPRRSPVCVRQADTVHVRISAAQLGTKLTSLRLIINGTEVQHTDSTSIRYDFVAANQPVGVNTVTAIGTDTLGFADTTAFVIMVNPPLAETALPAGVEYGITYVNNTTVTLALLAPYKQYVYVVGDFNDWKVDTAYYMRRQTVDPNNVVWWITLNGLTPGQEYAFQYLVDGNLRIADPYSAKVLDPWNDSTITTSTYPNLKPYPYGKTGEPVSVLMTNQPAYSWHTTNYHRPAKTDLVIYELLVRDFVSTHAMKTLIDTLGYLKTLGVNAIELMPVMEFEGNESWGYNSSFHLAADKYYGPANDLKAFVDSAHAKGMAVILDIVLNHAFGQSPLVRLYWDAANNRPAPNNPWFNPVARHPFNVGYDFNHQSQATKDYVDRVTKYWLTEYKVDGFRFDLSKGFTQTFSGSNVDLWGQYDQSRIDILERMAHKIWDIDSSAYVILEHFAANSEETVLASHGMMLWGNMNSNYNEAAMGYNDNNKSNLSWGSYLTRGWTYPHLITYMESHDEERLMYKNLQYGNADGYYNVKTLSTALSRIKLAAAFLLTIPGPKMIWQFGELGYDISIDFGGRLSNKPIRWDYSNDPARRVLFKTFAALTRLKAQDAFRSTNFVVSVAGPAKRITITHPSMDVTIIGNFDVISLGIDPAFSRTGIWYDYFSGDSINITNTQALRYLQPGEFHIYTTMKLPTPDLGEGTNGGHPPSEFALHQNYPNPFNLSTTITFDIPAASTFTLKIYNVLGQEIALVDEGELQPGRYRRVWNGTTSAGRVAESGVYFARLQMDSRVDVKKLLLIR